MDKLTRALDAVKHTRDRYGAQLASDVAVELVKLGTLQLQDYVYLARWSEGRDQRSSAAWVAGL